MTSSWFFLSTLSVKVLVCPACFTDCRLKHNLCFSLQPGHYSSLTAPNRQPTANQEPKDQCGNQHYSRELLMMGIVMPETCWAYKKYNKIINDTYLVLFSSIFQVYLRYNCQGIIYVTYNRAGYCRCIASSEIWWRYSTHSHGNTSRIKSFALHCIPFVYWVSQKWRPLLQA